MQKVERATGDPQRDVMQTIAFLNTFSCTDTAGSPGCVLVALRMQVRAQRRLLHTSGGLRGRGRMRWVCAVNASDSRARYIHVQPTTHLARTLAQVRPARDSIQGQSGRLEQERLEWLHSSGLRILSCSEGACNGSVIGDHAHGRRSRMADPSCTQPA
jgi:hypothetical protein